MNAVITLGLLGAVLLAVIWLAQFAFVTLAQPLLGLAAIGLFVMLLVSLIWAVQSDDSLTQGGGD